jgi:hypothetical protein
MGKGMNRECFIRRNLTPYLLSNFHFNIFKFKHLNL